MRLAFVIALAVVLAVVPVMADTNLLSVAAELGAGALAAGLYSCFVAGVFSDVMEVSASLQRVDLSEVPLPTITALIAGGVALLAAPLITATAVTAAAESFGVTAGSAYAFSVISAYVGAAFVFDREWRRDFSLPEWLPAGLPEWVVTLTVVTSLTATIGFNLGAMIGSPGR
jgi:hypothetical protein